jgi:hypothetical protein
MAAHSSTRRDPLFVFQGFGAGVSATSKTSV